MKNAVIIIKKYKYYKKYILIYRRSLGCLYYVHFDIRALYPTTMFPIKYM